MNNELITAEGLIESAKTQPDFGTAYRILSEARRILDRYKASGPSGLRKKWDEAFDAIVDGAAAITLA